MMLESIEDYAKSIDAANHYRSDLEKIAATIYADLGTNYFALCRLRGQYLFSPCIATNMLFGQEWFQFGRPMIAPPSNGFYLASQVQNLFEKEFLDKLKTNYGIDNLLFYIEHRKSYTDIYSFASEPDKPNVLNNYINRAPKTMLSFIPYFRENFKNIIKSMEQEASFIYIQEDQVFQDPLSAEDKLIVPFQKKYTLQEIKKFEQHLKLLPDRILDSLVLAASGMTAKESARILKIEPKTVEGHIEKAKNILQIMNKRKLIDLFLTVTQ